MSRGWTFIQYLLFFINLKKSILTLPLNVFFFWLNCKRNKKGKTPKEVNTFYRWFRTEYLNNNMCGSLNLLNLTCNHYTDLSTPLNVRCSFSDPSCQLQTGKLRQSTFWQRGRWGRDVMSKAMSVDICDLWLQPDLLKATHLWDEDTLQSSGLSMSVIK